MTIATQPLNVLFLSTTDPAERWRAPLTEALAGDRLYWNAAEIAPAEVDVVLITPPVAADFAAMTRLRLAQSLWMGVESLLADPALPPGVPLARMIDPHMTRAMVESAVAHVMAAHLRHDDFARLQREGTWQPKFNPTAGNRRVGILGLGELGRAVAAALRALEFQVSGWRRTPGALEGIGTFSGRDALPAFLARVDILVVLVPHTDETRGMVDAALLQHLPEGAVLINLARGALVNDDDLLAALDAGRLRHAVLDVFNVEPLPVGHRYWTHPRVTVTPHIAALTNPRSAARFIADNLRRLRVGQTPDGLVERARGY